MLTLERRFPQMLEILGERKFSKEWEDFIHFAEPWFIQLEQDCRYLTRYVRTKKLIDCFRKALKEAKKERNKLREIVHEIYAEAILASACEKIELHLPTHEGNKSKKGPNFDFRVMIQGCEINGEMRTRRDDFPFNLSPILHPEERGKFYGGSSATVDKHFLEDSNTEPKVDRETPESTVLREILEKTLAQLPGSGRNIIILGSISRSYPVGLKEALYGGSFIEVTTDADGARYHAMDRRCPNGLFMDNVFARINAVVWMHLEDGNLRRTSGIFFNPNASEPFPEAVKDRLIQLFDRQAYLKRELNSIKEKIIRYCSPEKIILFGSLAQGKTHEWSDLDLTIIKKTDLEFIERSAEILRIIRPRMGINLFVYTPDEFCRLQREGNFFIKDEIEKRGKIIYDRTTGLV